MLATYVAPAAVSAKTINWHRWRLAVAVAAACALFGFLAWYGSDYYVLDRIERIGSPKHSQLRSSGTIGYRLGLLGAALFAGIFLYPIRKRWRWLAKKGNTRHWLDFHILMGLTAPVVITFHSSFRLQGIAGVAYWIMMSVVVSGIVGRYFYSLIPRRLDAAEMSHQEMQSLSAELAARLEAQNAVRPEDVRPLLAMPTPEEVQRLPLVRALLIMGLMDLKRPFLLWRLRRRAGHSSPELRDAVATVRKQAALSKEILFLSKAQQIFHLWHVVHKPFSYSFLLLVILHVTVVLLLGYY